MNALTLCLVALLGCATLPPAPTHVWVAREATVPFEQAKSVCFARHVQYAYGNQQLLLGMTLYHDCMVGYGYESMAESEFRRRCAIGTLAAADGCPP